MHRRRFIHRERISRVILRVFLQSKAQSLIEMDSIVAVKLIQAKEIDRSIYSSLIKEIRHLMCLRDSCITHVTRTQNRVSDSLANFAHSEGRTMTWLGSGSQVALEASYQLMIVGT